MKHWLALLMMVAGWAALAPGAVHGSPTNEIVYVLPIRDDISRPMVSLVRRGVKEAMAAGADVLIIDMDTNGGEVNRTIDIMKILNQFKGRTITYVNQKAYSAGAFISFTTQKIYMAPQSVIGAAAVIMMTPGGSGAQDLPSTMEIKMTSALSALVRAQAEKNGHNTEVIQAMMDKKKELKIDGEILNPAGSILTLTDTQAAQSYGKPPKPLVSSGTVQDLETLITEVTSSPQPRVHYIRPTGAEKIGSWLNAISPILLIIGVIGLYIEFKTPGFGLPGIVGITAFALYFFGGYAAGLSGLEWVVIFLLGLALVAVEMFVFPGTIAIGLAGAALMFAAIVMALVDLYPRPGPGLPELPTVESFSLPLRNLLISLVSSGVLILVLSRFLPRTALYRNMVLESASGMRTEASLEQQHDSLLGQVGVTISPLYPGGKAQFGERLIDVTSQGEFIPVQTEVKIIGFRNNSPIVEVV